ncbi:HAD family hydrolase [Streptomyces chiangmaiensis]
MQEPPRLPGLLPARAVRPGRSRRSGHGPRRAHGPRRGERRESLNRTYFRSWRGEAEREVTAWGRRWFAERSQEPGGFFLPGTLAALRGHVADGAMLVLVSASFPALLAPIAEAVGASEVACTRPVVRGGRFTGELLGPPMAGTAKWNAVRTVLARHPEVAAADCYGYGDHVSDLPMLAEVGHPVVVGRSPELTRLLPGAGRLPGP